MTAAAPITFLRLREVKARTGLSHSTIYRWMEGDKFPKAVELSEGCVRWVEADIEEWQRAKIASSGRVSGSQQQATT